MDWLQFASSLAWPLVAVGGIWTFRKPLRTWLDLRPSRVKAGPVEVVWDVTVDKAVEVLDSGKVDGPASLETTTGAAPRVQSSTAVESLTLQLREVAKVTPAGAIMEASRQIEMALIQMLSNAGADKNVIQRTGLAGLAQAARTKGLLPETIGVLESIITLRNIAAHGRGSLEPAQAFEFMALADLVVAEARHS
ncbi:hypothetical protein P9990_19790 [Prescottella equi]|uniref:hypothetical protein n=1 Tax=Rhodococcus hoagii TaxID=43767 RepID=UPI0025758C5D|nr:hypothetical protein [Prescottella equi]WJJ10797.1 hypothetical protein P9990_19790 [Prescottella equi]